MTSVRLMLNKCRMLNDGTFPLVFQLIHSRQKRIINTGYRLKEYEFDESAKRVNNCVDSSFSEAEISSMNRKLSKLKRKIEKCIKKMTDENESFTVTDLVNCIMHAESTEKYNYFLLSYIKLQINSKQGLGKDGIAAAYRSTLASLSKYISVIYSSRTDVRLSEINSSFVSGYERYLCRTGVSDNTSTYYLRNFRTLYNKAVREIKGFKDTNPFKHVRTKPCCTVKRALSRLQICEIAGYSRFSSRSMEFSRDLYLFSFYAQGMSFVDVVFLRKANVQGGMIVYKRHKSGQLIRILVTPQMQSLIDKYRGNDEFIFPVIDLQSSVSYYKQYRLALARVNRHLARIANCLLIDVPLTTYTARHTWATLARYCGAPISIISAGLGHTSEEITRIYLKEFDVSLLAEVNMNVTKFIQIK